MAAAELGDEVGDRRVGRAIGAEAHHADVRVRAAERRRHETAERLGHLGESSGKRRIGGRRVRAGRHAIEHGDGFPRERPELLGERERQRERACHARAGADERARADAARAAPPLILQIPHEPEAETRPQLGMRLEERPHEVARERVQHRLDHRDRPGRARLARQDRHLADVLAAGDLAERMTPELRRAHDLQQPRAHEIDGVARRPGREERLALGERDARRGLRDRRQCRGRQHREQDGLGEEGGDVLHGGTLARGPARVATRASDCQGRHVVAHAPCVPMRFRGCKPAAFLATFVDAA